MDALFELDTEAVCDPPPPCTRSDGAAIALRNVSFGYARGDFSLEGVSLHIAAGEFVGIVGASGGGKSTLIDLLMGFYTPEEGMVLIDGLDIRAWSLASLRETIGFVSQNLFLWNQTIRENIAYPAANVSAEQIQSASKTSQMHDFIVSLPEGYETLAGLNGADFSGGERQRLAISRAILRNPRILLLDGATSALDALTELKVRDAIESARRGRTTVVMAHRLSTVIHADRIIVLGGGKVVEMGTPRESLANKGPFHALYEAQKLMVHETMEHQPASK